MKRTLTIEQYKEIKDGILYRKYWEDTGRDFTENTKFYVEYNSGEVKEITKEEYYNIPKFYESHIKLSEFRKIVEIHNGNLEEEIHCGIRYAKCELSWTRETVATLKRVSSVSSWKICQKEKAKYILVSNQMHHYGHAVLTATFMDTY